MKKEKTFWVLEDVDGCQTVYESKDDLICDACDEDKAFQLVVVKRFNVVDSRVQLVEIK